jgi:hypothetical protein
MTNSRSSLVRPLYSILTGQTFRADIASSACPYTDLIGPRGAAFDNDDIADDSEDEDLKADPVSQMDMKVSSSSIDFLLCLWFSSICFAAAARFVIRVRQRTNSQTFSSLVRILLASPWPCAHACNDATNAANDPNTRLALVFVF